MAGKDHRNNLLTRKENNGMLMANLSLTSMVTKKGRRKKRVLFAAIPIAVVALFLLRSPLHAAPKVEWSTDQIEVIIAEGDRKPVRVTMTATRDLPATKLEATPSLDEWVTAITPSELPAMIAGEEMVINLVVTGDHVGVVDGTLKVRELSPRRTLARPLPIVLDGVATIEETLPSEVSHWTTTKHLR